MKMNRSAGAEALVQLRAQKRLREWTKAQFSLPNDAVILIREDDTTEPGFPPFVTTVSFWTAPETRHDFRVYQRSAEVSEADLPPAWMRDALIVLPDDFCKCC